MKKIFSAFLTATLLITTLNFYTTQVFAKENSEVANLALMLPESDMILAIDVDKTLNVVGPSLLSQDAKKIENLKKLMKSLENVIGLNPYEINQIVAGVKLPSVEEKNFLDNLDFTVIFRTVRSNNALLEDWSKKIDAIEEFNDEKEPTEKYMDAFKRFRYYRMTDEETEKIGKLNKEFDEIVQKINQINGLLSSNPAKNTKSYRDSIKKNKTIVESINLFKTWLKKDVDIKTLRETSIKLQNRWYEISLEDAKRGEKLTEILKESKDLYPKYRAKTEDLAKVNSLINFSNWEFYAKLSKKSFGIPDVNDYKKDPNEMMKEKLDEIIKSLNSSVAPKPKQTNRLVLVARDLQRLDDAMTIRLKALDDVEKFETVEEVVVPPKSTNTLSKSIKNNAKISDVNGKRLITIDLDKISFWNPGFEIDEQAKDQVPEAKDQAPVAKDKPKETAKDKSNEVKIEAPRTPKAVEIKTVPIEKDKKDEPAKKKEMFAIGYVDEKTMVLGFESGIRSILSRKEDYKNPKAAEMLSSFKNPLVSFATNSKIFQNYLFGVQPAAEKKKEKKETPTDKFWKDLNVFGSVEFDGDSPAASDLIMSLGFSKNNVSDVFSIEADEEGSSVFEVGDYQISKAIFYDLLNTLKAFKASISFKFEKKKVAALIENAPQLIEEAKFNRKTQQTKFEKTKIENIENIQEILISPKFYTDLFGMMLRPRKITSREGSQR